MVINAQAAGYPRVGCIRVARMTVTIDLPPEVEAGLEAQAHAEGLALPQYLARLFREQFSVREASCLSPAELATAWRESVKDLPRTPPVSDEAISRDNIYGDRGR